MARSLFWVWAGLLCLALSRPASSQTLWVFDKLAYQVSSDYHTMGIYSQRLNPVAPSSVLLGSPPSSGRVGEVAVVQRVIAVGESVPLPTYADGTSAREGEIFWVPQLWLARFNDPSNPSPAYQDGDGAGISFSGRLLVQADAVIGNNCCSQVRATSVEVLVTVVAVRNASPTTAEHQTWGSVKARYRD